MVNGETTELLKWVINLGAFGLVSWLVRHTFKSTIPRLAKDFRETLQEERRLFFDELRSQRDDFKDELKYERGLMGGKIDGLTHALTDMDHTVRRHFNSHKEG